MVDIQYEEDLTLALSTLGAATAIAQVSRIDSSRENGFRIAKLRIAALLEGKTAAEGPLSWGISCNMSASDIGTAIKADPQAAVNQNAARGEGTWLKMLGLIALGATNAALTGTPGGDDKIAMFDEYVINWSVPEGQNFQIWAFNMDTGALTTGSLITAAMEIFGVWLRD